MAYTKIQSSWDRRRNALVPFWLAPHGILQEVDRTKKPTEDYHPLAWADRPIPKDTLKRLWVQSEGKPLAFARLIEQEHGIKEWEVEDGT
jgi:hypothetical protein